MHKFKLYTLSGVSTLALAGFSLHSANAAGFYIQEQSVSGLGSAFAGQVATPRDSSIVYYNPAGMTHLKGAHSSFGTHILAPSADLDNTGTSNLFGAPVGGDGGNPYSVIPIPNGSVSYEILENKFWAGFAISAPFGLENDYNDNWFGRFDSTETRLTTLDFQPSIAIKLNDILSIGGGINIQFADANLESIVFRSPVFGEEDNQLNGDDTSLGYNIGLLYQPVDSTTFGLHYRSAINHELRGRLRIRNATSSALGLDTNIRASADLNLPDIAQFGVNHRVNDKISVQAGATWFGWNTFQDITVQPEGGAALAPVVQNYQTTWAFAVGGEYNLNPNWTLRAGYQYDETPTTDEFRTSLTPDGDRNWLSLGATYKMNDKISLDMAATYVDISDEKINLSRNGGLATIQADTSGSVGILAFGLNYKF